MTAAERAAKLAAMPGDYKPNKALEHIAIDVEKKRGFDMLDDENAGKVIKRFLQFAVDYSQSYDDSLIADANGLSELAAFMLDLLTCSFKRMEDYRRESSYLKSGANGGGIHKTSDSIS